MQTILKSDVKRTFKLEDYYEKYHPLIFSVCRRYSKNHMDAMDLAHDVFIKCYESFPDFREESKISTWIYRIAVNSGIDYSRKKKTYNYDSKKLEVFILEFDELIESRILNKLTLEKLFSKFSHQTKEILFLYYVENLNQVEISQIIGISRQAVKKHLDKLNQNCGKLKKSLINEAI